MGRRQNRPALSLLHLRAVATAHIVLFMNAAATPAYDAAPDHDAAAIRSELNRALRAAMRKAGVEGAEKLSVGIYYRPGYTLFGEHHKTEFGASLVNRRGSAATAKRASEWLHAALEARGYNPSPVTGRDGKQLVDQYNDERGVSIRLWTLTP